MSQPKKGLRIRRAIYQFIEKEPGHHFRELSRILEIPQSTLKYHLALLMEDGMVTVHEDEGKKCYYPKRMGGEFRWGLLSVLRKEIPRGIVLFLLMNPGGTLTDLESVFTLSPSTLYYHLKKLEEKGLLFSRREGRNNFYFVACEEEVVRFFIVYKKTFSDEMIDRMLRLRFGVGRGK